MDRRQFLIRTAAASGQLILPPFFDRALAFVENHGEALIEAPPEPVRTLYAAYQEEGVYWIIDGLMPDRIPPPAITWREYLRWSGQSLDDWYLEPEQLDDAMSEPHWETHWF